MAALTAEQFGAIARAIADPRRYAMLKQIAEQPVLACGGLDVRSDISAATISHHLRELQEAGLIEVRREGRQARLTFCRPVWAAYVEQLRAL